MLEEVIAEVVFVPTAVVTVLSTGVPTESTVWEYTWQVG